MAIDGGSVEIRIEGEIAPSLRNSLEETNELVDGVVETAKEADKTLGKEGFEQFSRKTKQVFDEFADNATNSFIKVIDQSESLSASLKGIGSSLKNISFGALTTGLASAAAGLVKLSKGAIADTSALENVQIQMIGLTHSVEAGNKAMGMAVKYFKNNPFNRFDVTNATKNLIQYGAQLDEVPSLLDKLGKVSLSTGAKIDTLSYYYQKMVSDGRINTMDLIQMTNQQVPIMGALAKQLNTTAAGVREFAAQGKISIEDFKTAFETLADSQAMERFNATLSRQLDRFKGRLSNIRAALAGYTTDTEGGLQIAETGLYRSYTRMVKTFADVMDSETGQKLYAGFEKLGAGISKILDQITKLIEPALKISEKFVNFIGDNSELILPLLGSLAVVLTKIGGTLPIIGPALTKVSGNFGTLFANVKNFIKLKPGLSAILGLLSVGFAEAMKNDEEFKKTISELFDALKDIANLAMDTVKSLLPVISDVIKTLANSGFIKTILLGVASALKGIAQAVASISPETLAGLLSFFVSLKMLKTSPITLLASAFGLLITYVNQFMEEGKSLPEALLTIGHNMMTGLLNGLVEGAKKVWDFVKSIASGIVNTFKNILGIHSPSTVMYGLAEDTLLGYANGIEDNKNVVQVAMENLANDILKLSQKVIKNKVDFGLLDVKQEYQEWKKVSQLFTQGSEQYQEAIEEMEDARKRANLEIVKLQRDYNSQLDSTIKKIGSMYGLFSEVNLGEGKNSSTILKNLDQQVAKLQEWATAQEIIANSKLDSGLIEELKSMGVDSTYELSSIANMTASELETLNDLWLKKQAIANESGVKQMAGFKEETLNQIQQLKDGIDGTTVDVTEVGNRLVSNISEGVYGAMPTLESAFDNLGSYIADAQRKLTSEASGIGSQPEIDTDVPDTGLIKGFKEEITKTAEKLKDMIPNILLGIIGAWGASKIVPMIFKKIGEKLFTGGTIKQGISGLFTAASKGGIGKDNLIQLVDILFGEADEGSAAQKILSKLQDKLKGVDFSGTVAQKVSKASRAVKPAQTMAQSATEISQSVQVAGQGFSKANGWMSSIQQGAKTIIWIAGAIAAVGLACGVAYNQLKDVEWKKFNMTLVDMAEAILAFGGLGKAIQKLKIKSTDLLKIAGIAGDIWAVAKACRSAYDDMKDMRWDTFADVLSKMASAVAVFGVFAGIFGIKPIALAEALGLAVIAGIALDIAGLAEACKTAYDKMREMDWVVWGNILEAMVETLKKFGLIQGVMGIFVVLEGLGWLSIMAVCDSLINVAEALNKVYTEVPDDLPKTAEKVEFIAQTLEQFKVQTDIISGIVTAWEQALGASIVESAARIAVSYGNVVDAINKIATFKPDREGVTRGFREITAILNGINQSTSGQGGIFHIFPSGTEVFAGEVEKLKSIVKNYEEMVPTLQALGENENQISDTLTTKITKNIENIKTIVTAIGTVDTGGWVDTKENDVKKIQSILNNFVEMVPTIKSLGDMDTDFGGFVLFQGYTKARKAIENIKDIVLAIGEVKTGGWIETKENDVRLIQSILNKFTELAQTTQLLNQYPIADNALEWIKTARNLVWEIGQINTSQSKDMSTKEAVIDSATSLAQKLGTFSNALKSIENPVQQDMAQGLVNTVNTLLDGISNNLQEKVTVFENIGITLGQSLATGLSSTAGSITEVGQKLQTAFWWSIQNRMDDEYWQGRTLGERFRQGLYDVDYANSGWWAVQGFINGVNNRAYYSGTASVWRAGYDLANNFLNGLKYRAGEGSPWKTTFESGQFAIEGLVDGLKNSEAELIGEATSIADQVVNALSIDNLSMNPDLDVASRLAPSMAGDEYGMIGGNGREVTINQNIEAYTPVDIDQIHTDLSWMLSKV